MGQLVLLLLFIIRMEYQKNPGKIGHVVPMCGKYVKSEISINFGPKKKNCDLIQRGISYETF